MRVVGAAFSVVLAVGLAACSGEIYRTSSYDGSRFIYGDARGRIASLVPPGVASRPGLVDPKYIMCVEPSPDVAVAVANSLGGGAGITGKGAFSISSAGAEGLAQLAERTTAIQAILRQGYQSCLDYSNGAISATTYSLRQARLDDLLVTLVLAEDVTGAYGRSGAAIGTTAAAESRASASMMPDLSKSLDQSSKDLTTQQNDVKTKQTAYDTATTNLANYDKANPSPADLTDRNKLVAEQVRTKSELDQAIAARDTTIRNITGLADAASKASAGVTTVQGQGGLTAEPNADVARVVGDMQQRFVEKNSDQAYISTCLTELGLRKNANMEDEAFRQLTLGQLKGQVTTPPKGKEASQPVGADKFDIENYMISTQSAMSTQLTQHCERYLTAFLWRAQEYEQARKLLQLDLESKRMAAASAEQAEAQKDPANGVHPLADFNMAKARLEEVEENKKRLDAKNVPAVSKVFIQEAHDALQAPRTAALKSYTDLKADPLLNAVGQTEGVAIVKIEDDFRDLNASPDRQGSKVQQQSWALKYEEQQLRAKQKVIPLRELTTRLMNTNNLLLNVLQEIERIEKIPVPAG